MANPVNYSSRNFNDYRTDLVNYIKQYYSNIFTDFNDSSVGMMLLELNAAIGDNLSYNTDRMFQETKLDFAQERRSLLSIARTYGLKIPGKRPSVTIVDFSVTVPVMGDSFDASYAPLIRAGSQVTGSGKVFELIDDVDFSSPFALGGIPNRLVIPNTNSNGNIVNYTLTKREVVINGFTKIFKKIISVADVKPFLTVILPDDNVLSIESIITLDGTNYTKEPTLNQFLSPTNRWYEVDSLSEDKIFVEDNSIISDNISIIPGKYISTNKRFISEYTDLGFTKLTFGGGSQDIGSICDFGVSKLLTNKIGDFINNMALGTTPTANTTMFIKYRVGGGLVSNLGSNIITGKGNMTIFVNGANPSINNSVKTSLSVNNPIPALGGRDEPSIEEIRNLVKYNFSSQNRCVAIKDYQSRIGLMPGKYGSPFRYGVFEEQNKIKIYTLGIDSNGKLNNTSTNTLNANISNYLSNYRMLNDSIEISNGKIVNLGFEFDLLLDKQYPKSQIISEVILTVNNFMNINNFQMGDNIYLSNLIEKVNNVSGVLNVMDVRVYNKVGGGKYSLNETQQPYVDDDTREIDLMGEYTIYGEPTTMYEIFDVNTDIKIRTK
jgi:hypothetical protein